MIKTVVGSFDNFAAASKVAASLMAAGFMQSDINVIANNTARAEQVPGTTREGTADADDSGNAAAGALTGGAISGAAGLAISLMGLAIPGIGPILAAGPIVTALAGAGAGAVAGGLIGGLTEIGVPENDANYYAESVRRGGALVTVRADGDRVDEAEDIMRHHGAVDIEDRAEQWRGSGWSGYSQDATPFTYDQIEKERTRYASGSTQRSTSHS